MRAPLLALALLAAGCSSDEGVKADVSSTGAQTWDDADLSGPSGAREYADLDPYNGETVELTGIFTHEKATHGILKLASGLKVSLPHADQYLHGDDWLKYVGRICTATGVLYTVTENVDGYRRPSLFLTGFYGPELE